MFANDKKSVEEFVELLRSAAPELNVVFSLDDADAVADLARGLITVSMPELPPALRTLELPAGTVLP
ncbi:uncharacterized protein YehS (DUF1456 family) [Rhodopseudomonas rhenobacensis]|uniref:Uncharacterized protein YehS (DUF1456 family) n=1 Tax=Rhodopseudomonas rhenobacensis TaxID=87461 RepID=A0A7W7Z2K9_9BRAD|nr:hypothetical protein [Rhodopseudomonas rhenobacensis]MBB5046769.1 uncharacterized protein YehS (DUF1456 family) [Rhodopseudomonas rhenobacensis]